MEFSRTTRVLLVVMMVALMMALSSVASAQAPGNQVGIKTFNGDLTDEHWATYIDRDFNIDVSQDQSASTASICNPAK